MSEVSEKMLVTPDGAPLPRIGGFEIEHGLYVPNLHRSDTYNAFREMLMRARLNTVGFFTDEGAKMYLDLGDHPEYSTPEDVDFLNVAYWALHGQVAMAKLLLDTRDALSQEEKYEGLLDQMRLMTNLTDYKGMYWGNHLNVLAKRQLEPSDFIINLLVHHISRIVWSGSGAVAMQAGGGGYVFELSERARAANTAYGSDTTRNRSIVNDRDEALADERIYRRIHDIINDANLSPVVLALRMATESIVLRATELGVRFDDLLPEDSVQAMKEISWDPTLQRTIPLRNGRQLTGLDIQKSIAERSIKAASASSYLTLEEQKWGEKWLDILDRLGTDPDSLGKVLDWVMVKKQIARAIESKARKPNETDFDIAVRTRLNYQERFPRLGQGWKMLERQLFELSPSKEVLEDGPEIPQTRARLRGNAARRLNQIAVSSTVFWDAVKVAARGDIETREVLLGNPYETENAELEELIEQAGQLALTS